MKHLFQFYVAMHLSHCVSKMPFFYDLSPLYAWKRPRKVQARDWQNYSFINLTFSWQIFLEFIAPKINGLNCSWLSPWKTSQAHNYWRYWWHSIRLIVGYHSIFTYIKFVFHVLDTQCNTMWYINKEESPERRSHCVPRVGKRPPGMFRYYNFTHSCKLCFQFVTYKILYILS